MIRTPAELLNGFSLPLCGLKDGKTLQGMLVARTNYCTLLDESVERKLSFTFLFSTGILWGTGCSQHLYSHLLCYAGF